MMHSSTGDGIENPFLVRLRRLTALGATELSEIEGSCSAATQVRARRDLLREGDGTEQLTILLEGWACRFKLIPNGRRQITALLLPGDICNLDTLYVGQAGYSVTTLTACTVATIKRATLRTIATRHPAVGAELGLLLAIDNAMLTERAACLGRRSAREHLAHFLCEMLLRLTLVGQARGNEYALHITQEEISDVLGLTPIHVNRVLRGLKIDGIIEQRGHNIVIRDWHVLRQIAAFQSAYLHPGIVDADDVAFDQAPAALRARAEVQVGTTRAARASSSARGREAAA